MPGPRGNTATYQRILIRLPNWLGDALMARPLLHALRTACPGAELRGVLPGGLTPLLAADGVLDRVDAWPARGDRASRKRLREGIRAWRPEAALVLPPSFSSAWFARSIGAPVRIGYAHEWRGWTLSRALRRPARGDMHLSAEYAALAGVLLGRDVALPAPLPDLPLPRAGDERAPAHESAPGAAVILGPGAIYGPAKRWSAERFIDLGGRLVAEGHRVLVCGTGAEHEVCAKVARGIGAGAADLSGRTTLPDLARLCATAMACVCNDSGLAHLSAAMGAHTVVVFGSTSSAWTAPLGRSVRVIQHAPVCSPCFQRTCSIGYTCLERVGVDAAYEAVVGAAA